MNSWKVFFVVLAVSDQISILCFYPEGICSETGLKYDLATQSEVGMRALCPSYVWIFDKFLQISIRACKFWASAI